MPHFAVGLHSKKFANFVVPKCTPSERTPSSLLLTPSTMTIDNYRRLLFAFLEMLRKFTVKDFAFYRQSAASSRFLNRVSFSSFRQLGRRTTIPRNFMLLQFYANIIEPSNSNRRIQIVEFGAAFQLEVRAKACESFR